MKKLLLVLLFPLGVFAQEKHHEVGIFAGTSSYFGDLQERLIPNAGYRAAGGLTYKYFLHPSLGLRFGVNYASLWGADSVSESPVIKNRNLDFETNLIELYSGIEINLLPVERDYYKVSPYIFAGIGLFYYNPYTQGVDNSKIYLRPLSTEGQGLKQYPNRKPYSLVNVGFPLGGGVKFFVGKEVMISAEMGFRYTLTDYLDDVSKTYVNMDTLFAVKGQQSVNYSYRRKYKPGWDGNYPDDQFVRGDKMKTDWYWFAGINVAIYFDSFGNIWKNKALRCPRRVFSSR